VAPSLVPFLKQSYDPNRDTITAFANMGETVIPLMVAIFQQENASLPISMEQINQKSNAAAVIGKIAASDLNVIRPLLSHQDARVREGAAQALGEVHQSNSALTPEVLSMLMMLLKDPERDVRWQATQSLGWMGDAAASTIPALLPLLKDSPGGLDLPGAAYALSRIGERSIPFLIPLLKDQDQRLRTIAKETLMYMPIAETSAAAGIPDLLRLLKDSNPNVRSAAAEVLGTIGEQAKAAIPSLIPLLRDSDAAVRSSATDALIELGYLKGKRSMPRLVHPSKPMRLEVEVVRPPVAPSALPAPQDPVRPPVAPPPLPAPQDPVVNVQSESVRQIFVQALKNIPRPDSPVEYRVMVASDGSITQILPLTGSAEQLLPRLKIAKPRQIANPVPTPIRIEDANVVPRAFRVFVSSDSIQVLAE
jgi:HEAT repeat protein